MRKDTALTLDTAPHSDYNRLSRVKREEIETL